MSGPLRRLLRSGRTRSRASFLRFDDVVREIDQAWDRGAAYSLVRAGDGELSFVRYPRFCDEQRMQFVLRRAMADRVYKPRGIAEIQRDMMRAFNEADVVSIHDSYEANDLCVVYEEHLEHAGLRLARACGFGIHLYLQSTGALDSLIRRAGRITLLSGRDVLDDFRRVYPHAETDQLLLPVERQYALASEQERLAEQHYPTVYRRIMTTLEVAGPRHLHLVGAGLLGKAYCAEIQRRGGFAIDIGSVFDYWANVPTREGGGIRAIEDGRAAHPGESRWPAIWLGATPEPTGIASSPFRQMLRPHEIVPMPR